MRRKFAKWTGMMLAAAMLMTSCGKNTTETPNETQPTTGAEVTPGTTEGNNEGDSTDTGIQDNGTGSENAGEVTALNDSVKSAANEVIANVSERTARAVKSLGNTRRLQQAFERMQNGDEVTVAYLGGSITEGYLVNSKQNYAYKTTNWLKKFFNNDSIKNVNAGLSGTPSTIGLLRVQKDILDEKPDIVFIEFAVNDGQDTTSKMMYESLVNRIINSETAPAVVLLFTILENGYTCEEHMSAVGEAYELPMISVGAAITPDMEAGIMTWADYSLDGSHPNKDGHTMISEFIQYLFAQVMVKDTLDTEMDYMACKALGSPYAGMNFYNTENLYIPDLGGFKEANSDIQHFPHDWIWQKEAGGSLKFTMTGKNLILLYKESNNEKNMATMEVYVDGKLKTKVNSYSPSGWNNPQFAVILNEVSEGEHEIELKISDDTVEKNFHLLGIGTTGTIHSEVRVAEEDMPYQERAIVNVGNTYKIQEVMKRAEAGEELTIGFIGGSITQGSGASNANKCYAKLVYDWWCATYPQAKFTYVNAGIGATTSQFACARVEDDLLSQEPDFVMVEFSVNDTGNNFFGETYESLVRKIVTDDSAPAVMVLNMVQYDSGANAQMVHNAVAKAYGIPAVSMQNSIYKEIVFGRLTANDVSADMLHPNDKGHAYGAEIVTHFLTKVKDGIYTADAAAELPTPLYTLESMSSVRYDNSNTKATLNGFKEDTSKKNAVTDIFKHGYTAKNEGESVVFENVYGSTISLQYRKTNTLGAPLAEVIIDGNEAGAVGLDGNYPDGWGNWLYLHTVATDLDPTVPHTVEVRITESAKKDFYLVSVIASGAKNAE